MRDLFISSSTAAAALVALLILQVVPSPSLAFPFFYSEQEAPLPAPSAPPLRDEPSVASIGDTSPNTVSSNVAEVLQQAVLSATKTASRSLSDVKQAASSWWKSDAAETAKYVTKDATNRAKQYIADLGSLLQENAPAAAQGIYRASSAAGAAAKELSSAAKEAEVAVLAWADHLREEVRSNSKETAEHAAAAADLAKEGAVEAAEKAIAAAEEARRSLSLWLHRVRSMPVGSAAAEAARETSNKAEEAVDKLEKTAIAARNALASWAKVVGDCFHAGTSEVREAADAARQAAKSVAESLQDVSRSASRAADTVQETAGFLSSGAERGADKADTVVDMLTTNAAKPLLSRLAPWLGEGETEETEEKPTEECDCSQGEKTEAGCNCSAAGSLLAVTKRLLGLRDGGAAAAKDNETKKVLEEATADAAAAAAAAGSMLIDQDEFDKLRSALNAGTPEAGADSAKSATANLRPSEGATWLGGLLGSSEKTEASVASKEAELPAVAETLPSMYREGETPLDCNPLPPYKDCLAECDPSEGEAASASSSHDSKETATPKGLTTYEYTKRKECYLACKAKWLDGEIPGCLDSSGKVVPGEPPAAKYRSTTTTTTTTASLASTAASASEGDEAETPSWSLFFKHLQKREETAKEETAKEETTKEEIAKEDTANGDKQFLPRLSWFFPATTTTTTSAPANKGLLDGLLFGGDTSSEESSWLKRIGWKEWKGAIHKEGEDKDSEPLKEETKADSDSLGGNTISNTVILGAGAALFLLALVFVMAVLRLWEAHHRDSQRRQQNSGMTETDMQRPLMQ